MQAAGSGSSDISVGMQVARADDLRAEVTRHLDELLGIDGVLALPSAPGIAPRLKTPQQELNLFRQRLISLTCIAGLAGLPQVGMPPYYLADSIQSHLVFAGWHLDLWCLLCQNAGCLPGALLF